MSHYGLTETSERVLIEAFSQYPQIKEVLIFGSRAKGNYKKGSDVDLAIRGEQCTPALALTLSSIINEELLVPYMVDVIDYESLTHQALKEHIDRVGKVFYRRN